MKKGLISITALAMVLGVGVAVGAHQASANEAKADDTVTVYCKMAHDWWKADGAAVGVHYWGGSSHTDWPGVRMTHVPGDNDVWKYDVPSNSEGIIFTRVNGEGAVSDFGAKTKDLSLQTDGKNLFTITTSTPVWGDPGCDGEWSVYSEPYVPAENGYYLVGSETDWSFEGAPKLELDSVDSEHNYARILRYNATKDEAFKVYGYNDGYVTYFGYGPESENYVASATGLVNVFASKDGKIYVDDGGTDGIPSSNGYYLHGEQIGWPYSSALEMTPTSQDGNLAYYMDLEANKDDEIRVSSYYTDRVTFKVWANANEKTGVGHVNEKGNFVFDKGGHFDIYAKNVGDVLNFFVDDHAVTYNVAITAVFFTGASKTGSENRASQLAYSNEVFNPSKDIISGYVARDVYTDENCSDPYVPAKLEADGHLYIKYTKVGFYVISGAGGYSIDTAVEMNTSGINPGNKAEAYITVAAANETYSFVEYKSDGVMYGQDGLGTDKDYSEIAVYEDSHIKFLKSGNYAVYLANDNKVYLNSGSDAFCTNFLSLTTAKCDAQGKSSDIEALKDIWEAQETAFNNLSPTAQEEIVSVGFNGGKEDGTEQQKFMARYAYIIKKYGSSEFKNFVFPTADPIVGSSSLLAQVDYGMNNTDSTALIAIVSVIAIASISAVAVLVVAKKRKHQ